MYYHHFVINLFSINSNQVNIEFLSLSPDSEYSNMFKKTFKLKLATETRFENIFVMFVTTRINYVTQEMLVQLPLYMPRLQHLLGIIFHSLFIFQSLEQIYYVKNFNKCRVCVTSKLLKPEYLYNKLRNCLQVLLLIIRVNLIVAALLQWAVICMHFHNN